MVVQICKTLGARVITTSGSDKRVAKAKTLGPDELIIKRRMLGLA